MSIDNDNDDQVNRIARDENARIRTDLFRALFGADLAERTGRMNRGGAASAKNEVLQKQKEKDERHQREAFKRAQEALQQQLDELNKLIAEMNLKIIKLEKEIETTQDRLKKEFGKDWKEKFERGELDKTHFLYQQWLLQQQQMKDFFEERDRYIRQRDKTEELLERIEARDATVLEEMQANETARHGQDSNTKMVSGIHDSQTVTKLESELGLQKDYIEESAVFNGSKSHQELDLLFDENTETIAFSKTIEKSTIKGPPVAQQFAKASEPDQREAQIENNAKTEVALKNSGPAS